EKLTEQEVRHVARLSRLHLGEQQVRTIRDQLSAVLDYMAKLNELNLDDVEPLAHPTELTNCFRSDAPTDPLPVDQALATAPEADPPFFKVPKVLGDSASS
ncbi:MAG: Asp-tRNA(Asn)/Glu-tRNA(Gln) amidotransferase subunit GatC, partial [Phycisphaerae bacterium]|nr:Asp-tRNA(Asn)/Glu-tRNA(Gln) amidotransferase subunit GatC [Phycisphaerae bacterium]